AAREHEAAHLVLGRKLVLDRLELVDPGELVEVPERDRDVAGLLGLRELALEVAESRRGRGDLGLAVEDADDLAHLGDAVEAAGAELAPVGGEAVEVEQ